MVGVDKFAPTLPALSSARVKQDMVLQLIMQLVMVSILNTSYVYTVRQVQVGCSALRPH